jgi:hypothetical protein
VVHKFSWNLRNIYNVIKMAQNSCFYCETISQYDNGSWEDGWFYKYGLLGIFISNIGLTTAFVIKAMERTRLHHKTMVQSAPTIELDFDTGVVI